MSNKSSINFWIKEFSNRSDAHSDQNIRISNDYFNQEKFSFAKDLFNKSKTVIEIGCGTGELSKKIKDNFNHLSVVGTDLSISAINFANKNYSKDNLNFICLDLLNEESSNFDISICSNVLEHFKNPFVLIDKMINKCKYVILLVPYNQPCVDGYDEEGGPGHVFCFTEDTFKNYNVLDSFKFQSSGWQHSSCGEEALQFSIILKGKND